MNVDALLRNNPLCRILGIPYPVLQAGMFQVATGRLAAAVSQAGGLGVIGSAFMEPGQLREEIRLVRSVTSAPFGVDVLFAQPKGGDPLTTGYTGQVEEHVEVVFDESVPVLVSGLGNPVGVLKRAHQAGMTVMSLVGNVRQAKRLAGDGIDVIIASGSDGGGHVGRVGTAALIPAVVDAVNVPVVAAGGLADGRGLVAALAFGAVGIWLGTRFIATHESVGHQNYKDKIVEIDDEGTVVTRGHSGKPNRMIRNKFTESWEGREAEILPFPQQMIKVGNPASVAGRLEGDVVNGVLPAGQSSAIIREVKSAAQVVEDIMAEARAVLQGWDSQEE